MNCFVENGVAVMVAMSHEEWVTKVSNCFSIPQEQLITQDDDEMPVSVLDIDLIHNGGLSNVNNR